MIFYTKIPNGTGPMIMKVFINSLKNLLKDALTSDIELAIAITANPFFITVDASLIGLGAVIFQLKEDNRMKVIYYKSRILNTQERNISTLDREIFGIVHAL